MSKERIEALLGLSGPPLRAVPAADPAVPDHALLRRIGQGSYGEVWLARNVAGTHRAIKVVYRAHFHDARPYEREYAGMLRFEPLSRSNEGFVDILQLGRNDAVGFFYYVMELADDAASAAGSDQSSVISNQSGAIEPRPPLTTEYRSLNTVLNPASYVPRTLASVLAQHHRLPMPECVGLGINLNLALGHLHRHGLIHRDVKPANIIFVGGVPKLADIGLVADIAGANTFVGTEGFIPPEGPNSPQADIYALGKLLYEASMGKDRQEFPEPFTQMEAAADAEELLELNAVILKACAPDPRERYATAEDMNADLALLQSGRSVRRKHAVEQRLKLATRVGAVAAVLALAALGAWLWQARQTREARRLSEENRTLAGRSRDQLVQLQVANGVRQMNEGNPAQALAWFAKALPNVADDPARDPIHRMRIASVVESHPRLLQLFVHDSPVARCQFTPDGQRLISQTVSNRVSVFDLKAGSLLFSVTGASNSYVPKLRSYAPALTVTTDGRRLVLRGLRIDAATEIRDLTDGRLLQLPDSDLGRGHRVLDSLDGRAVLVAKGDTTAQVLDLDSGEPLSPPMTTLTNILDGRFAAGGRHVALLTGTPGDTAEYSLQWPRSRLQVWELSSGHPVGPVIPLYHNDRFLVTRDGARLVTHAPPGHRILKFRVYDSITGKPVEAVPDLDDKVALWVVNRDAQWLVTSAQENATRLWNPDSGETLTLNYAQVIRQAVLSPDGLMLATASDDRTAQIWNIGSGKPLSLPLTHASWLYGVAFHPGGHLLATCGEDQTLRVWDLAATSKAEFVLRAQTPFIEAEFSPDGRKIATIATDGKRLRDAKTRLPLDRTVEAPVSHGELQFSPDGKRFVTYGGSFPGKKPLGGARQHGASIFDAEVPGVLKLHIHTNYWVEHAEFSPDSTRVVTAVADGLAQVWNAKTGVPLGPPLKHVGVVHSATFSPDGGRIATSESEAGIRLWDAESGELLREIEPTKRWGRVQFSPDGRYLLAGGGHQVAQAWDVATGSPVTPPVWHGGAVNGVTFSPDGQSFLTHGLASHVGVWNFPRGDHAVPPLYLGSSHPVGGVEFSRDGRFIVSHSDDGAARIWAAASGELVTMPLVHAGGVYSAHFNPAGDRVLTAGQDNTARLWKLGRYEGEGGDVAALGELLSGTRLLANGAGTPLSLDETLARFDRLRTRMPRWFQPATPPAQALWHEEISEVAEQARRWDAVIWHMDRALTLNPESAHEPTGNELFHNRAWAHAELGHWPEAAADFEQNVRLDPDSPNNWCHWLITLVASGQTSRYESASGQLLDHFRLRFRDDLDGSTASGYVLSFLVGLCGVGPNTPENLERALGYVTALEAKWPALAFHHALHAGVFLRAGRYAEAIHRFKGSDKRSPLSYYDLGLLALAHHGAGETAEARRCLELADIDYANRLARGKSSPDAMLTALERAHFNMLRKEVVAKLAATGGE